MTYLTKEDNVELKIGKRLKSGMYVLVILNGLLGWYLTPGNQQPYSKAKSSKFKKHAKMC